jgi:DNA polymerase III subunit gamma/tau
MPIKPDNEKEEYQVLARRYRPKTFEEVIGQEAIVTTLKNGMKQNRLSHAYLFSGPRGTGKTTLARLLAKALNCQALSPDLEPCNGCTSCREIATGRSLDVIEIDGASNRGIDDIRQINETVGYLATSGKYKIYIIDEVHMLTKEAFNALLKTLEEPPPSIKFFFATTEPHKVLPTILSRCQRFNLRRLPQSSIIEKLRMIASDLGREIEPEVFALVASRAEGGLRDAESLFDQLLAFHEGKITSKNAEDALGALPFDVFFELDRAGKEGNLAAAFDIPAKIFHEGKDLTFFAQNLIEHYRTLLLIKAAGINSTALEIPLELVQRYQSSSELYLKEQLLSLLELCLDAETRLRTAPSPRIALEGLLLKILRVHRKIPLDHLVERLLDLENRLKSGAERVPEPAPVFEPPKAAAPAPETVPFPEPKQEKEPEPIRNAPITPPSQRHDTLLQFAAVELEGKIIKK